MGEALERPLRFSKQATAINAEMAGSRNIAISLPEVQPWREYSTSEELLGC
jgi:hypothetical protein